MGLGLGAGVGKIKNEIVSDTNSKVEHAGLCMAGQARGSGRQGWGWAWGQGWAKAKRISVKHELH